MKAGSLGELLLRELPFQPERANGASKLDLNMCWHRLRTFASEACKLKTQPSVNTIVLPKDEDPVIKAGLYRNRAGILGS